MDHLMSRNQQELDPPRVQRYEALLDALESLTRHDDLTKLFHELAQRLRKVVEFDFISVMLHDPDENVMRLHILESEQPMNIEIGPNLAPSESPGGWVWQSQEPIVISDYEAETRFPHITTTWRHFGMKSGYYLPLTTPQRRLGAINFASARPRTYDSCDLALFARTARLVAVGVDNALNFQSAQDYQLQLAAERDRLRLLLEINNAVVTQLDFRQLFQQIAGSLRRVLQQDYLSLALYDQERQAFRIHALDFPAGKGLMQELMQEEMIVPFQEAPAGQALKEGRPVVFGRADLERLNVSISRTLLADGVQSHCAVPLVSREHNLGTLNVGRLQENSFIPAEVDLLTQVAGQIALAVENALAYRQIEELKNKLNEEKLYLEDEIRTEYRFAEIVGSSQAVQNILRQVEIVAPADTTVLIQGETGTGKELIARAIHNLSTRKERTFVKLNCAAIPSGLLESELFGHEKGAFTGAIAQKVGRFELADGGTLFLDEIGEIPLELQPKLLRVLQEQEFERLGGTRTLRVNVRLVAATNRDLARMVADRLFRSDLYYRLNVFPLTLPPLRERREDIPSLVRYFVQQHARRLKRTIESIPAEAMAALTRYPWPGNVRELENFIERSVLLSPGSVLRVAVEDLKAPPDLANTPATTLADAEREHILAALSQTNWVIGGPSGAAARLGMKRTTLISRMQKLGIARPR
ncbi:MAG TPA: sigma 54-interacting transcriptional regulator [Gemmataceae bacterium]|nr:sigma 54-interacting transcriptional regulator [Gemmataceae bacterium]